MALFCCWSFSSSFLLLFCFCFAPAQVLEGTETIQKMEAVGSRSGATAKTVTIRDCGEL
jgi:hypothetical protein